MALQTISPAEAHRRSTDGSVDLIDVRDPAEYRRRHARPARSMPVDQLNAAALDGGRAIALICQTGVRSARAAESLAGAGEVLTVTGGTAAWAAAGLPVDGAGGVSLERQVRITAGAIVAVGSALAVFVHPAFVAVPLVIGTALVVTGLLDWCGLGLLLARMPWNRGRPL